MKRFCSLIIFLIISNIILAYGEGRLYDFGLPKGEEVGNSLIIAIPLLIIGFIICWFTMWNDDKKERSKAEQNTGCVGCLIMLIGGAFLIPLLAWVEALFSSVLGVVVVIGIIVLITTGIWNFFNKK
ncbi:MAG: hypothetical protein IJK08_07815 [Prevotella sp.]|nr:hypothetical protein [Prevotella sp.]